MDYKNYDNADAMPAEMTDPGYLAALEADARDAADYDDFQDFGIDEIDGDEIAAALDAMPALAPAPAPAPALTPVPDDRKRCPCHTVMA